MIDKINKKNIAQELNCNNYEVVHTLFPFETIFEGNGNTWEDSYSNLISINDLNI